MNKKKRNILLSVIGCLIILAIITGGIVYHSIFSKSFRMTETAYVYIDRDDNIDSVLYKLEKIIAPVSIKGFQWLAQYNGYKQVRTGRYAISSSDNMLDVYLRISRGHQTPINLSFNNIRTREQFAQRIGSQLMIDSAEIADRLSDSAFCARLGYRPETIVSLFIPNTCEMYWNISADEFFERMQKEHGKFWTKERLDKAQAIGLTPEEVSTLASIVEEETNNNAEKPMVAGLYINRLHKGMPLQADPTIKFALQDFSLKRIYGIHLNINSPYNTYKNQGLPPGPIRIPSIKGIDSVLNYTHHPYIYMCAKEDFSGTHNFAKTYAEHQVNARKYQRALNKKKIF